MVKKCQCYIKSGEIEKSHSRAKRWPTYLIVLSGVGSRLDAVFSPPLDLLNCKYELALASIETYRSFPNIDLSNNQLKVRVNGEWENILIPIGSYDLPDISKEVQCQIQEKVPRIRIFFRLPAETCEFMYPWVTLTPPPVSVGLSTIYC